MYFDKKDSAAELGSEYSMNSKCYMKLETAFNDDRGTGIILCALAEGRHIN